LALGYEDLNDHDVQPSEAKSLRWRDVVRRTHRDSPPFIILNVRGKAKYRSLVAANTVVGYLRASAVVRCRGRPGSWLQHQEPVGRTRHPGPVAALGQLRLIELAKPGL